MRVLLWVFLIAFTISSCDRKSVFENTVDFNNGYWLADSVKTFEFSIPKSNAEYNIFFSLRNGVQYPHRNVYVHYSITDTINNILDEELRNFQLFHAKSGYPFGNGSGNLRAHSFDLLMGYKFPYAGKFRIKFKQYMRYDSLQEVFSIGVRVELRE